MFNDRVDGITWKEALFETEDDITGALIGGDYDNFSAEETAYVEGVEAAQYHFKSVIRALKRKYGEED